MTRSKELIRHKWRISVRKYLHEPLALPVSVVNSGTSPIHKDHGRAEGMFNQPKGLKVCGPDTTRFRHRSKLFATTEAKIWRGGIFVATCGE